MVGDADGVVPVRAMASGLDPDRRPARLHPDYHGVEDLSERFLIAGLDLDARSLGHGCSLRRRCCRGVKGALAAKMATL
jgi:hypothetical protein